MRNVSRFRSCILLPVLLLAAGCNTVVLNPSGDIAARQRDLLVQSTYLMLLIIVPVIALTLLFAWRYRHNNKAARYEPDWHHSTQLELVIWAAPLLIIICLGALTWLGTHLLDPYRPLDRISAGQPVTEQHKPLEVRVVALDWKWLFIYPEQGIATINEMVVPVNTPVRMRITAQSVMNSLYIPQLAGQVYAMPGMETKLHGVLNKAGVSQGFSANYSGAGFSGMKFVFRGVTDADFEKWVQGTRSGDGELTREGYVELAKPSENEPPRHFARVDGTLFHAIVNRCVSPGTVCMDQMMSADGDHSHHASTASSSTQGRHE
jgi:cytochrome o ubiquinol oxidase subunit 2